ADGARAHDGDRFGHFGGFEGLEIGPDLFAVWLDARQDARARAGGDDDVFRLVGALAQRGLGLGVLRLDRLFPGRFDLDLAGLGDGGFAPDDIDLVLLHQELHAVVHAARDAARALDDGVDVEIEA